MSCVVISGLAKSQAQAPKEGQSGCQPRGGLPRPRQNWRGSGVEKEGLRWTSGGSLPSSTLKVVLEGRQGPLCWGGWCLVQWREHGPQTCGWAARGSLGTPGGGGCRESLLQGGRGSVKVQSELSA